MAIRSQTQIGFSVIELLVVLSIVAVLLAVLLPALAAARSTARSLVCKAHLGQMALGWESLMIERRGQMPDMISPLGSEPRWCDELQKTMLQAFPPGGSATPHLDGYVCPTATLRYNAPTYGNTVFGYSINVRMVPDTSYDHIESVDWFRIENPTRYPVFADPFVNGNLVPAVAFRDYFGVSPSQNWGLGFHHPSEQVHLAYADGHVAASGMQFLNGPTDSQGVPYTLLDNR